MHHALKCAVNFHQRGELRDPTGEGQYYRVAGLNLLVAIIVYWNTLKLGDAVFARNQAGLEVPDELLVDVPAAWSPSVVRRSCANTLTSCSGFSLRNTSTGMVVSQVDSVYPSRGASRRRWLERELLAVRDLFLTVTRFRPA